MARTPHKVLVQRAKHGIDDVMGDRSVNPRQTRESLLELADHILGLVDHLQTCVDALGETESE